MGKEFEIAVRTRLEHPAGGTGRKAQLRVSIVRQLKRPRYLLLLIAVILLVAYLAAIRPMLMPSGNTEWVELAVVVLIALATVLSLLPILVTVLVGLALAAIPRTRARARRWFGRSGRALLITLALVVTLVVAVLGTQWLAYTPPIRDAQGNSVPHSIASLETVRLGGADQSILIRGWNTRNPVLLVLPGGPGGSYMGEGSRVWGELEKHFTVVEWDPRGVAKSYGALKPTSKITVEQNVSDTIELSEKLRSRFHQEKIYLLGHSGGSIYGIWAIKERPDLYAAYIGGWYEGSHKRAPKSVALRL